ncbi:MAG: PG0541 family transporter-associated protein [Bacteroidota bacterium]
MKAVLIVYNQAHSEKVNFMLNKLGVRGFTKWETVLGRGSVDGDPHLGTHTWPEQNSATLCIVDETKVNEILGSVKKLDLLNKDVGIRAFTWDILQVV